MIYWIYELALANGWLETPAGKVLNVFQYQTFRAGLACLVAFLFCVLSGERVIRKLISMKIGQPIRTAEEVHKLHELHGGKAGTPTMGGVLIIGGVTLATLLAARWDNLFVWVVLFVFLSLGLLGFADDYRKVVKKNSAGVSARVKLVAQFGVAAVAGGALFFVPVLAGDAGAGEGGDVLYQVREHIGALHLPFLKEPVIADMWPPLAMMFFSVVIVGCSNAVNLTDGLDGLATGCTITVAFAYAVFSYVVGNAVAAGYLLLPNHPYTGELAVVCLGLVGAAFGFLWFNCHPAKVFMGDTGSLALGGMLGTVAICAKQEVVLVVVGGVFVMEAMSVILQVGSFKLRGKRIFAMSPIHHHFELKGWHESQVIVRFWTLSVLFALIGLATLKLR